MNFYLSKISDEIDKGNAPPPVTTREFLSWFGAQRRGYSVVARIRRELKTYALDTVPDFELNYIDSPLKIARVEIAEGQSNSAHDKAVELVTAVEAKTPTEVEAGTSDWSLRDPTYRISKLAPANQNIVSVKPDSTLAEVVAILLLRNFSQLPVMTNERDVKGVITWTSIGSRLALSTPPGAVGARLYGAAPGNSKQFVHF